MEDRPQLEPFEPDLSPEFQSRLDDLTDLLLEFPNPTDRKLAIEREMRVIEEVHSSDGDPPLDYLATLHVLLDLIEVGYEVVKKDGTSFLRPPDRSNLPPEEYKERERQILQKARGSQLTEDSVRDFIDSMENPKGGASPVTDLIADGEALASDLEPLDELAPETRARELRTVIQPYLQVAKRGESCEHTGLDTMDIWRYFRYTWLTPYRTVPGRNINLLVRDGARENDPVMGLLSIASPMMNLRSRDDFVGWTIEAIEERLSRKKRTHHYKEQLPEDERTEDTQYRQVEKVEFLESKEEYRERKKRVFNLLLEAIDEGINLTLERIRLDDLASDLGVSKKELLEGDEEVREGLKRIEDEARKRHEESPNGRGDNDRSWKEKSSDPLFRKKRANTLQKVLSARRKFNGHRTGDPVETVDSLLDSKDGRQALSRGLREIKKRGVGAGIMNIRICGGIPPYSHLLAGKLAAMLAVSPKVVNTYQEKYEGYKSNIASSMKGEPIEKPAEIVLFETTSLFKRWSAQYDRVRIPTSNGQIEYEELGRTEGMGSIQFGPKTRSLLHELTKKQLDGHDPATGRFGEGVAPRLRKIRGGLEGLGLPTSFLHHKSPRIVFGIPVANNWREFLFGIEDEPDYPWDDESEFQEHILDHWAERWAQKRVTKPMVLRRVKNFNTRDLVLSEDIEQFDRNSLG